MNNWLSENYLELRNICNKFSTPEEVDDLLHVCIEQFMKNKKVQQIPDNEKLFFFTKLVRNQYHSKSSTHYYIYRRHQFSEIVDLDIPDKEYSEEQFDLKWVYNQLDKFDWYYKRLFELYIEEGCSVTKLSRRTTIPINSVSRDINKVRKQLKQIRNGMRMW